MAESIYTQLENQTILTPVDGKEFRHPLPVGLFPSAEIFESPEKLIEWANKRNFTTKLIQKGLQKAIVEVRAVFKSCPKEKVWTEEMGLENLKSMEWKTVDRSNRGSEKSVDKARLADCIAMISKLSLAKMEKSIIKEMCISIYGEEMVNNVFEALSK